MKRQNYAGQQELVFEENIGGYKPRRVKRLIVSRFMSAPTTEDVREELKETRAQEWPYFNDGEDDDFLIGKRPAPVDMEEGGDE